MAFSADNMRTMLDLASANVDELRLEVGNGRVQPCADGVRLELPAGHSTQYRNAQLDDYHTKGSGGLAWSPPLRMAVTARFSLPQQALRGTAGFGFWNDPFGMTGDRTFRLPRAAWFFFASEPSNLPLAVGVPGCGWKASTLDATRPRAWALGLLGPLAVPLLNSRRLYCGLWPLAQQVLQISETLLTSAMDEWHTYELTWDKATVAFAVDGQPIAQLSVRVSGKMGFVAWIDNQFMVATPWGRFRHGVLPTPRQYLDLRDLVVEA